MICQICKKEFLDNRIGVHITRTHKMPLEQYYCKYIGSKGICLTCKKPTKFISLSNGYYRFCCNKCVGLNKDIQNQKKQTTLNNFGVKWPTQSKEVQQTIQNALETKYGCRNAYNISSIKEKAQKNSHTSESNKKRNKSQSKTKKVLWSQPEYKQDKLNKCINTNLQNFGKPWSSNSDIVRSKISNTVKSEDCQNRTKQTNLKRYGVEYHTQSKHYINSAKKRYLYDSISFDSSWELAFYIYHIDKNIKIERSPCIIKYKDKNNKSRVYQPDFLVNDQLVEIKGEQFFDKNGKLINIYNHTDDTDKMKCMKKHNVLLLTNKDIKPYLRYCIDKYKTNTWYKQFRKY